MEALQRVVRTWIASEQEEDVNTAVSGEYAASSCLLWLRHYARG